MWVSGIRCWKKYVQREDASEVNSIQQAMVVNIHKQLAMMKNVCPGKS